MYKITGIYSAKLLTDGTLLRTKRAFTQHLNTENGVMAFLEEQKPFTELVIMDMDTLEDKTKYFIGDDEQG